MSTGVKTPTTTKILMLLMVAVTAIVLYPASSGAAEPGRLDLAFGSGGATVNDFGPPSSGNYVADLVTQSSGKIVQVVNLAYKSGNVDIVLSRFDGTGSMDPKFGRHGVARLRIGRSSGNRSAVALAAAVDRNDRIVISAKDVVRKSKSFAVERLMVIRLTVNGKLDRTFGTNGRRITNLNGDDAHVGGFGSTVVDSRNRILVASVLYDRHTKDDFVVSRFTAAGRLDRKFGRRGVTRISIGKTNEDQLNSIALGRRGEIFLGGQTFDGRRRYSAAILGKLTPGGKRDTSFGRNGVRGYRLGTGKANALFGNEIDDLRVLPDGKIVAVGASTILASRIKLFAVAMRFEADGSLDDGFGVGGVSVDPVSKVEKNYSTVLREMLIGPDGSIYAAGALTGAIDDTNSIYADRGCLVTKFTPSGAVDRRFGQNGVACEGFRVDGSSQGEFAEIFGGSFIAASSNGLYLGVTTWLGTDETDAMVLKFGM